MELYSFLRQLADSWALLLLFLFFVGVVAWAFRPGSKQTHAEVANIVFRNDTIPTGDNRETHPNGGAN